MSFVPRWTIRRTNKAAICLTTMITLVVGAGNAFADEAATPETGAELSVVEFVNQQIEQGYKDNEITPSEVASDEEWVRRVYLDIVGRIPSLEEVKTFLEDESPRKKSVLIENLVGRVNINRNTLIPFSSVMIPKPNTVPRFQSFGG